MSLAGTLKWHWLCGYSRHNKSSMSGKPKVYIEYQEKVIGNRIIKYKFPKVLVANDVVILPRIIGAGGSSVSQFS